MSLHTWNNRNPLLPVPCGSQYFLEENARGPLLYSMVDDPEFQLLKSILPVRRSKLPSKHEDCGKSRALTQLCQQIRQDMENIAQAIVMAFDCSNSHKRLMKFVESIIDIELGESDQASAFLRANTLSSKVASDNSHAGV